MECYLLELHKPPYVGLYCVEKYWFTTGLAGFGVFKFALCRLPDQAPPPWTYKEVTLNGYMFFVSKYYDVDTSYLVLTRIFL